MKIIPYLLSAYIITKPFYFWHSGMPQVSDYILLITFFITLAFTKMSTIVSVIKNNSKFFIFLVFVQLINMLYALIYDDAIFILHGMYYIFDALGIILFFICLKNIKKSRDTISSGFKIALITQLVIFFLGTGRYYDITRYMGTFNDPNQFAYFCLLSFGFIFLLKDKKKRNIITELPYFAISLFLIIKSASTGMFVGMGIFAILYAIPFIKGIIRKIKHNVFYVPIILACLFLAATGLKTINFFENDNPNSNNVITRVEKKISRAKGDEKIDLWQERGYDHIYYYPYYVIYGAGEGGYWRFDKAFHQDEIHATFPSFLFCYGIIPTTFVLLWFYEKLKKQNFECLCVYIALIAESFTLINSRQVLFWVIFAMGPLLSDINKVERIK